MSGIGSGCFPGLGIVSESALAFEISLVLVLILGVPLVQFLAFNNVKQSKVNVLEMKCLKSLF